MKADLRENWHRIYEIVPEQLRRVAEVGCVASAFNTNIDSVVKINGKKLAELADLVALVPEDLQNPQNLITSPKDAVRGIIKCFTQGIAEEWLCADKSTDEWLAQNLGDAHLQMGGQAGIIANVLAVLGVQKVCVHTASHPQMQAKCFLNTDNLLAFTADGNPQKAYDINRIADEPLVHRIIEFAAGDSFEFCGRTYTCPRANRFIATYDTANLELKIDNNFVQHLNRFGFDYLLLSGFHNLTATHSGLQRIAEVLPMLQQWKRLYPRGIIHLELASTQDKLIRTAILQKLAPLADSLGINEREALDALEICAPQMYADVCRKPLSAPLLLDILQTLKNTLRTPRIQLHFLGTYLTLQDKNFGISSEQNRRGMMLAATVAAAKAGLGNIESRDNLLWAHGRHINDRAAENMDKLAEYLHNPDFALSGITSFAGFDLIAVPTILIDKPLTLVGMGDTISSVSLIGAR